MTFSDIVGTQMNLYTLGTYSGTLQKWMARNGQTTYNLQMNAETISGVVRYTWDLINSGTTYLNNFVIDRGMIGINKIPTQALDVEGNGLFSGNIDANYVYAKNQVMQTHQTNNVIASAIDTWYDLNWNYSIDKESISSWYDINALDGNKSIIINGFNGIVRVQGCVHPKNNGVGNQDATIYLRVLVNGNEARCLQASMTKGFKETGVDIMPYTGTISVENKDIIRVQWRTDNTNLILSGSTIFDNPVSASVNFERISDFE
jgi:hypothetical protein